MTWRHYFPNSDHLLAILASPNQKSIHKEILTKFEGKWLRDGIKFSSLDIRELIKLPYVTNDIETPEEIKELDRIIRSYRNIVIFTPENGPHFSAFFKNIVDWLSIPEDGVFKGKRVIIVCVSTTQKLVRTMEEGVRITIERLGNPCYSYINFNQYVEGKDETERIYRISKEILSSLI